MAFPALAVGALAVGALSSYASGKAAADDKYALEREGRDAYQRQIEALYGRIDPRTGQPRQMTPDGRIYDSSQLPNYSEQMQGLIDGSYNNRMGLVGQHEQGQNYIRGVYGAQGANQSRLFDRQRSDVFGGMTAAGQEADRSAANLSGRAERTYEGFGREAEGVAGEAYKRQLAEIGAGTASRRSRMGYNSSDQMLDAGARGEAQYGYSRSMADIAGTRAQMVGGAQERSAALRTGTRTAYDSQRFGQLGDMYGQRYGAEVARGMQRTQQEGQWLGDETALRESALAGPEAYRASLYGTQYGGMTSQAAMYPNYNLRMQYRPNEQPNEFNQFVSGVSGRVAGAATEEWLNKDKKKK